MGVNSLVYLAGFVSASLGVVILVTFFPFPKSKNLTLPGVSNIYVINQSTRCSGEEKSYKAAKVILYNCSKASNVIFSGGVQ